MCEISGCDRPHYAKGMCRTHYRRTTGQTKRAWRGKKGRKCTFAGCSRRHESGGFCQMHLQRQQRHGDAAITLRLAPGVVCSVEGCGRSNDGRGYCNMHLKRFLTYGDPLKTRVRTDLQDRTAACKIEGCCQLIGKYGNHGMCRTHARQAQRAARPEHYKAKVNARRKLQRIATPPWVDMAEIERFYAACPEGHEVDHEIPLQGRKVRGLHVIWNLQYLPISANRRKYNRVPGEL